MTITEAGTLKDVFPGKDWTTQEERDSVMQTFTSLKIIGPINGTDIPYLQAVCGSFSGTSGNISELDLSEANIVSGVTRMESISVQRATWWISSQKMVK